MDKEVIYGKNSVLEAMRAGRQIFDLYVTDEVVKKDGFVRQFLRTSGVKHSVIEGKQFKAVVSKKFGVSGMLQGMVAQVAAYEYLSLDGLIKGFEKKEKAPFLVMLDGLEDVHNLGAILRSAEAVGVDGVIIPKHGSVTLNAAVARLSAGAVEYVPVVQVANLNRGIKRLKEAGIWFVGTDASEAKDYREVEMDMPVCVVIGSEGRGMSRLVKEACDFLVMLPMVGQITSLNASVAAALLMYEVHNQRHPVNIKQV